MSGGARAVAPARERRHTLHFLRSVRGFSPVFLDTDVDMTGIRAHRAAAREAGGGCSTVTYVLHTAARVLAAHPEANAAFRGRFRPRVARYPAVHGKITLDKTMNGQRVVLSAVLRDLERTGLDAVQAQLDRLRTGEAAELPEFSGARVLQRLPWLAGALLYPAAVRPLGRRAEAMGTFAVTSLGHRPVDGFHSVGGATITLGLGRTREQPVAREGQVVIAPTMRLNMSFDHRVIDGAEAADVLAEVKEGLESFQGSAAPHQPALSTDAAGGGR